MSCEKGRTEAYGRREAEQEDHRPSERRTLVRRVLGQRVAGIRDTGPRHRAQGLRRPGAHPGRAAEAGDGGPLRGPGRRGGAAEGGGDDRPHPARPGPGADGPGGADGGRSGGALHDGACRAELQAGDGGDLPEPAQAAHPAGAWRAPAGRGRPVPCLGAAPRAARHAVAGKPVGRHLLEDVQAGGGVGHDAGAAQPLPVDQTLQGEELRAVPDRGRVCASGPGAVRGRSGRPAHGL